MKQLVGYLKEIGEGLIHSRVNNRTLQDYKITFLIVAEQCHRTTFEFSLSMKYAVPSWLLLSSWPQGYFVRVGLPGYL